jgi:hypothetical protein
MARDQHSRVYSCILLTTLALPVSFHRDTRSLVSTGGEPGHER